MSRIPPDAPFEVESAVLSPDTRRAGAGAKREPRPGLIDLLGPLIDLPVLGPAQVFGASVTIIGALGSLSLDVAFRLFDVIGYASAEPALEITGAQSDAAPVPYTRAMGVTPRSAQSAFFEMKPTIWRCSRSKCAAGFEVARLYVNTDARDAVPMQVRYEAAGRLGDSKDG